MIKPKDPIRCRQCNHRIMYKMRTKRGVCHALWVRLFTLVIGRMLMLLLAPCAAPQ
jgi:DNA-directed RNA polymerase subunit RPC12/RpoP